MYRTEVENMSEAKAHVFFSGRVQGVFFRKFTWKKARDMGLNGWITNLEDGRVEAVFEGDKRTVEDLIEWCSNSHPFAKVSSKTVDWSEAEGIPDFTIKKR